MDIATELIEFCSLYGPRVVYIDPSAASLKAELRRQGSRLHLIEANNDVLFGIRTISGFLANGDFKICITCKNLVGEMQSYSWDPKQAEKEIDEPIKRMDHAIDAARYAIASHWGTRSLKQHKEEGRTLGSQQQNFSHIDPYHPLYNPSRQLLMSIRR